VSLHRVFDHSIVSGDHKCRILKEEKQSDRFKRGDCSLRKAPIEIVDKNDQGDTHLGKGVLDGPISIGVSGRWGVGKSSMIKLIRKALAGRTKGRLWPGQ
jgi:predicted ATP-dependent serine protease